MKPLPPSFAEQQHVEDTLRAMLRSRIFHALGEEPTPAELDAAVRREFLALSSWFRGASPAQPLPETIPVAPPSPWTAQEHADAAAAIAYARVHRAGSILEAVRAAHSAAPLRAAPLLPQCVDEYLCVKRAEGRAPITLSGYRSKLQRFAAAFPDRIPSALTPPELAAFLVQAKHLKTRLDWWECLSTFYKWCIGVNYAAVNPVPHALARPKDHGGAGLVLTPAETRALLQLVRSTDQIGFWCLALFAGLRTTEIRRLQSEPDPWSIVRLESGVIDLPDGLTKTGARLIVIRPVLARWLHFVRDHRQPFFPPSHFVKARRLVDVILAPRCHAATAEHHRKHPGVKAPLWGYNIARRSFISYSLALPDASYARVSDEAGNTEAIIRHTYLRRVTAAEAADYFASFPDSR